MDSKRNPHNHANLFANRLLRSAKANHSDRNLYPYDFTDHHPKDGRHRDIHADRYPNAGKLMSLEIKDSYTEFGKKWMAEMEKMKGKPYVKVGFPAPAFGKPREDDQLTVGEVAVYNEFGTTDDEGNTHVPERSFLRSTMDEKRSVIQDFIDKTLEKVPDEYTTEQALERIGLFAVKLIAQKINSNIPPPNAPSTIRRKQSSQTLIDTRQMVQTLLAQGFEVNLP